MRYVAVLAATVLGVLFVPRLSLACGCVGGPLPTFRAFAAADAVFVAVAEKRELVYQTGDGPNGSRWVSASSAHSANVTLRVERVFKGNPDQRIIMPEGSCSSRFEPGSDYLVYARTSERKLLADGVCGRTRLLSRATSDLEWLESGGKPLGIIYGELLCRRGDQQLVMPPTPARLRLQNLNGSREVTADLGGHFEFNVVSEGSYTLALVDGTVERLSIGPGAGREAPRHEVAVGENPIEVMVIARCVER
jgi:hypothetical protein